MATALTESEKKELKIRHQKLIHAYTSGVSSISHNGKTTTFRSLEDIKTAIDAIDMELGIKKPRIIKTIAHRGL